MRKANNNRMRSQTVCSAAIDWGAASPGAVCATTTTRSPMSSASGASILRKYIGFAPGG
jgi:hypothetical protein